MCTVMVSSTSADGIEFAITIRKTGPDTATITITKEGDAQTDNYNVFSVKSNTTTLFCTAAIFFFRPTVTCRLDETQPPGAATVSVTVASAPAHNGTTNYKVSGADGAKIRQFIAAAAFPPFINGA